MAGASLAANFYIGGSRRFRLHGINLTPQHGTITVQAEHSFVLLDDTAAEVPVGVTPNHGIFAVNSLVYLRPLTRNLRWEWVNSGSPAIMSLLYGSRIWCAANTFYTWFQCADGGNGGGTMINITQSAGNLFHNARFGSPTTAGKGNGVTCVVMQRQSTARFQQDAGPGTSTGFQSGSVGLALTGGSRAAIDAAGTTGADRFYVTSFTTGLSRSGGAAGDLFYPTARMNFTNNTADTSNAAGWTNV